jgi:hypothetical protein
MWTQSGEHNFKLWIMQNQKLSMFSLCVRNAVVKGSAARKSIVPPILASPLFPDPNIDLGKRKPKPKLPKGASPDPPSNPVSLTLHFFLYTKLIEVFAFNSHASVPIAHHQHHHRLVRGHHKPNKTKMTRPGPEKWLVLSK